MLTLLHIENIALIEAADITFLSGFNGLTGETGAGKSIIIDSLGAVLGGRTSRDIIRTGAKKAFVSATFTQVPTNLPALTELGIEPDEDGSLFLQRELSVDGKNVCRINGRPLSVSQLRQVGQELLNIHGQHDGQQLLDEEQHESFLDRFGKTATLLERYQHVYDQMNQLRKKIQTLQMDESEKARRMDSLNFQIHELEEAELQAGEDEQLAARANLLRNGEKYSSAIGEADYRLSGAGDMPGAAAMLIECREAMRRIQDLGEQEKETAKRLTAVCHEVNDLAEIVQDMKLEFDFSPEELDIVEGRLDRLYRLKKKYGATVEDMLAYLDNCRQELDEITMADDTLEELKLKLKKAQEKVIEVGQNLSKVRRKAAKDLEQRILSELKDLDMTKVRFQISFEEKTPDRTGLDQIRFLMSANAGEDLKPIAKIASGGELARIMLALKNVLAEQDFVGTLVFDEVDTGVSGHAAQRVAEKLAAVSRQKQVLCVTHLPQLAAMADAHFSVAKGERNGRTYTRVTQLNRQQRKEELARISGGSRVTKALFQSADELLSEAEAYKRSL